VRIDGKDAFINRLGRRDDPVAGAKAHAIAAQIRSDYQQGVFDRSLMAYQPLVGGKQLGLLEALRVRAESKRQAAVIHAHKLLERYGKPIRTKKRCRGIPLMVEETSWLERLHHRWVDDSLPPVLWRKLLPVFLQAQVAAAFGAERCDERGSNPIRAERPRDQRSWYYLLFLRWLSTGLRNAEIRGLAWDCIRWEDGEFLVCKSLRRDGYCSGQHSWATTKTGRERVVPLTAQLLEVLRRHKEQIEQLGIYGPYGLVFVTPTCYSNIYDHLVGRVWHRSLQRCGLKPRRLYAQRHSCLSHALAMGTPPQLTWRQRLGTPPRCCWILMPSQRASQCVGILSCGDS